MARRNKKLTKLKRYRDKLLLKIINLESKIRLHKQMFLEIRKALAGQNGTLRAYAITTHGYDDVSPGENAIPIKFLDKNDVIAELTLVYKMLSIEREYTYMIKKCLQTRDFLRCAALAAEHTAEQIAHDKMLSTWSKDHGFTKSLREECDG